MCEATKTSFTRKRLFPEAIKIEGIFFTAQGVGEYEKQCVCCGEKRVYPLVFGKF